MLTQSLLFISFSGRKMRPLGCLLRPFFFHPAVIEVVISFFLSITTGFSYSMFIVKLFHRNFCHVMPFKRAYRAEKVAIWRFLHGKAAIFVGERPSIAS